jgi:hypothetical protein
MKKAQRGGHVYITAENHSEDDAGSEDSEEEESEEDQFE